jgi:hypothetical protein
MTPTVGPPTGGPGATRVAVPVVQQLIWLADASNENRSGYLVPMQWRIAGPLDVESLRQALTEIVGAHAILRTGLELTPDGIVGLLRPVSDFLLGEHFEADPEKVDALCLEEAVKPIDVEAELPIRALLIHLAPQAHVLSIVVHHMAFDGGSRDILYREIEANYRELTAGRNVLRRAASGQYRELMIAREEAERAAIADDRTAYWRRALAGLTAFEIPPDRPRPPYRAGFGTSLRFEVPKPAADALAGVARRSRATLHMALVAACTAVLSRRSGRSEVTIGTTHSMRSEPAFTSVIGPLVNMVALRVDTSGELAFGELLSRVREVALDAYEAREVPMATVVDLAGDRHDPSRKPLFGVIVDLVPQPRALPALAGLTVTELPEHCVGSKHDLSIAFDNSGDALRGLLVWDTALYERASMERLGADLCAAILAAAGDS